MTASNEGGINQANGFSVICNAVEGLATNAQCMSDIANLPAVVSGAAYQGYPANNDGYSTNLIDDATVAEWNAGVANPTEMFHYMPKATFATFNQFQALQSKSL